MFGRPRPIAFALEGMSQFAPGPDLKLRVDVSQVPFDGTRAEEQAGADLGVREPIAGKFGDLAFLGGEDVPRLGDALTTFLTSCREFVCCAPRERVHAHGHEHLVRGVELTPRIESASV